MALHRVPVAGFIFVTILTAQSKEFVLGKSVASNPEQRDGKIDDPQYISYLGTVMKRVAASAGKPPLEVHATGGDKEYAQSLPGAIYVSATMLRQIQNEAELAGLFAHQLAHGNSLVTRGACVMASPIAAGNLRASELDATQSAIATLKSAGYDPLPLLEFLSKLAYDHPAWSRAISPDDLLDLRAPLEREIAAAEYLLDSSEFRKQHDRIFPAQRPGVAPLVAPRLK